MPNEIFLFFTENKVIQGLIILAVFLSGYFFYLELGEAGTELKDIEIFLSVLSWGSSVVGTVYIMTGFYSRNRGGTFTKNEYLGDALTANIGSSILSVVLYKLNLLPNLDKILELVIFTIAVNYISYVYIDSGIRDFPKKALENKKKETYDVSVHCQNCGKRSNLKIEVGKEVREVICPKCRTYNLHY